MKVSYVFPWVNPADPVWQEAYAKHSGNKINPDDPRFRENPLLRYHFRSIAELAPWIDEVVVIVSSKSQILPWMNTSTIKFILLRVDNSDFMNDHNLLMEFASKFHESKVQLFGRILNESIYAHGFKSSGLRGSSIFGLIKDIKEYVADMDRDEAIEEAVYAAVDYVKDGNL